MVEKINEQMKMFRVITPILLMILTGIMTFTGTVITSYLSSINKSIESIGTDLKNFVKETNLDINHLDKRVTILETRVKVNKNEYASSDSYIEGGDQ